MKRLAKFAAPSLVIVLAAWMVSDRWPWISWGLLVAQATVITADYLRHRRLARG